MGSLTDMVFVLVVVLDLFLLASSRLGAAIRAVALQGALLSLLALLLSSSAHDLGHVLAVAAGALLIKAFLIPWLMFRAIREMAIRREIEPFVGYVPSMILGGAGVVLAFVFSRGLPLPTAEMHPFLVPAALSTVWTGLLLVVSRRKAVTQVLGYIVMENGIYTLGVTLVGEVPVLVELGVILDVFVAVFIMSIAAYHISREFDHMDVDLLDKLKG